MKNILSKFQISSLICWTIIVIAFFILAGIAIAMKKDVELRVKNDLFILKAND